MKTTGDTGRKEPVPAMVTMNGACVRATSRTWSRVASQSCVGVVVTRVMWAGMTAAMGSPKDARQRWSSSAISGGKPRMTPRLMPSLTFLLPGHRSSGLPAYGRNPTLA